MKFKVHSYTPQKVSVLAKTAAGTEVEATMDGAVVELIPLAGGKTITLELHPENYAGLDMADMFAVDNVVSLGFTKSSE